jgi:hypothetical protein
MPMRVHKYAARDEYVVYAFVVCPTCHLPATLALGPGPDQRTVTNWFDTSSAYGDFDTSEESGWVVLTSFPPFEEESAPEHTPPGIARLYRQAAAANSRQEFETSGFLYGKILETSIKQLDPTITGTLAQRIDALSSKGVLSPEVTGWAHEIRIIRNDAVHEVEQIGAEDVSAIAEFTEAFLLVVYTMREKYKARQSKRDVDGRG